MEISRTGFQFPEILDLSSDRISWGREEGEKVK